MYINEYSDGDIKIDDIIIEETTMNYYRKKISTINLMLCKNISLPNEAGGFCYSQFPKVAHSKVGSP